LNLFVGFIWVRIASMRLLSTGNKHSISIKGGEFD
jgi:hypothetical protein